MNLSRKSKRGSAILVVLVLLAAIALMVVANAVTLHVLHQELDQIDRQQQKKYGQDSRH
jgi:type II secretory pathway component PulK